MLFRDSLIFTWRDRDIRRGEGELTLALLKEDKLISTHDLQDRSWSSCIPLCHDRWWFTDSKDDRMTFVDITSFRPSLSKDQLIYDTVAIPKTAEETLEKTLASLSVPSYELTERDGYPAKCIKCRGNTSNGLYRRQTCSWGLGRSFCTTCMIRYSESCKRWECAKPSAIEDYSICDAVLGERNDYCCDAEQLDE
jgi:hypothetical protein